MPLGLLIQQAANQQRNDCGTWNKEGKKQRKIIRLKIKQLYLSFSVEHLASNKAARDTGCRASDLHDFGFISDFLSL